MTEVGSGDSVNRLSDKGGGSDVVKGDDSVMQREQGREAAAQLRCILIRIESCQVNRWQYVVVIANDAHVRVWPNSIQDTE